MISTKGRLKVLLPPYSNIKHAALFPLGLSLLPPRNQRAHQLSWLRVFVFFLSLSRKLN